MNKKLITGLLASTLAFAPIANLATQAMVLPDDVSGTRYEEPVQILAALGIMVGDDTGEFRLEDNIKRSEAAKMAIHFLGLQDAAESAKGETRFPDVAAEHWASGYINLAVSQGMIIGDDEGNFRPNDTITYSEAMAIFVRALGYDVMAEDRGGYPNGYLYSASNIGLSKNVLGATNAPITRGNVAFLVNNGLTINTMEKTGFGSNEAYERTDKTILKDTLKVDKLNGQITAVSTSGIDGDAGLNDDEIKIDDKVYSSNYNMSNLLGYNVTFYVEQKDSGEEKVILAIPQKDKNSTQTITAELFEGLTTKNGKNAIEYFENENSTKTTVSAIEDNAKLIYNGKAAEMKNELLDIGNKSGNITLLDTDRNGIYDIVFVTDYYNIVVEEVTSTGKIIDKYGSKTIKLDKEENIKFTIKKGLQEIEVSDLKEFDVLSVAESLDGELFDIAVTNESVTGKVTGKDKDGFYIDSKHYKVAKNYEEPITINMEGTFYLDVEGKIAAVDTTAVSSDNYAYLIKAYYSTETEKSTFRLFNKEGKDITVTANEKIKFNGKSGIKSEDVVKELLNNGTTVKQLVTYTTNADGKLTAIEQFRDNTESGRPNINKFTLDYVMKDAVYNEKLNTLGSVRITEDTKIFDIQDDITDYGMASLEMFEDKQKYNVMIFDTTEEHTAKAVVVTNAEFETNAESPIAVVDKVSSAVNSDDEVTDMLTGYSEGKKIELIAEDEGIFVKKNGNTLKTGDIIQYKTNSDGEVVKIRVLFDTDEKQSEFVETPVEDLEILYGKVTKKFASSMNITVNDGKERNIQLPSDVTVYTVDTTKSKNNISVGTTGDIQAFDSDEGNRVFVKIYDEIVSEIVVIK